MVQHTVIGVQPTRNRRSPRPARGEGERRQRPPSLPRGQPEHDGTGCGPRRIPASLYTTVSSSRCVACQFATSSSGLLHRMHPGPGRAWVAEESLKSVICDALVRATV